MAKLKATSNSGQPDSFSELERLKEENKALKLSLSQVESSGDISGNGSSETKAEDGSEDEVTPWDVQATSNKGIDYDKLILKFG